MKSEKKCEAELTTSHFQTRAVSLFGRNFRLGDRRTVQVTLPPGEDGSPFRIERLIVVSTVARHFVLRGMRIDEHEQFAGAGEAPVPAACFEESALCAPLLVGPGLVLSLDIERIVPFERVPWWKRALRYFGLLLPPPPPMLVDFMGSVLGASLMSGPPPEVGTCPSPMSRAWATLACLDDLVRNLRKADRIDDEATEDFEDLFGDLRVELGELDEVEDLEDIDDDEESDPYEDRLR